MNQTDPVADPAVAVGQIFQHYKGTYYIVVNLQSDAEDGSTRVGYQEFGKADLPVWSHLQEAFLSTTIVDDKEVSRFRLLSSEETVELKRTLTDRLMELNPVRRITLIQKALDESLQVLDDLSPLLGKMSITDEELAKLTLDEAKEIEKLARDYQSFATLFGVHPVVTLLSSEKVELDKLLGTAD